MIVDRDESTDDEVVPTAAPATAPLPAAVVRWAAVAAFVMAVALTAASFIHLTGNLRTALGPVAYDVADFLYGPLWGAALVVVVTVLRDRIGRLAPRRMSLALLTAVMAAGLIVAVSCIRTANRHYHIDHPEMNLQASTTVLVVWTTLIAGLTGAGFHFLGWSALLIGWSGWTAAQQPRVLTVLYLALGVAALMVYLWPQFFEGLAMLLLAAVGIWQGILFWRSGSADQH